MFEYKITLGEDDYIRFNEFHMLNSPSGKKTLMACRLIGPLMCIMVLIVLIIANADILLFLLEAALMTVIAVFWIIFSNRIFFGSLRKRIIKLKKEGKLPYHPESILRFDDEYIHMITPDTENKIKYTMIEKIAATEKAIYIYLNSMMASIIPTTVFSDDAEKQRFLEYIKSKAVNLKYAQ